MLPPRSFARRPKSVRSTHEGVFLHLQLANYWTRSDTVSLWRMPPVSVLIAEWVETELVTVPEQVQLRLLYAKRRYGCIVAMAKFDGRRLVKLAI